MKRPAVRALRIAAGGALTLGGLLGFLPVLGFWMIPVGLSLLAVDLPWVRCRLDRWAARLRRPRREGAGR